MRLRRPRNYRSTDARSTMIDRPETDPLAADDIRSPDERRPGASITTPSVSLEPVTSSPVIARDSLMVRCALLMLGLLFSIILFEAAFRIIQPKLPVPHRWSDRPRLWYLPEGSPENRDFAYSPEKPPGTFRIIVIGDSFTYGGKGHFDDAFPKRLERMLNLNNNATGDPSTGAKKVEVLNWGVPGYSSAQEETMVKRALRRWSPDLIVLEITLNDPEFKPYRATRSFQRNDGSVHFSNPIITHWRSLGFILTRIYNSISQREYVQYYFDLFEQPKSWAHFADAVENMRQLTTQAKVPLFAMVFPLFSHRLDEGYPFAPLHQKIEGFLTSQGIRHTDLLPSFAYIPPERLQAIPGKDSHPNEIAHRIAADALYDSLRREGLLPDWAVVRNMRTKGRRLIQHRDGASKKNRSEPAAAPTAAAPSAPVQDGSEPEEE